MWIIRNFLIIAIAACLSACGKEDSVVPDQQTEIEKFLDNNDLEYDVQNRVYRHFGERVSEGPQLERGDEAGFWFELYPAKYSYETVDNIKFVPKASTAIYSNKYAIRKVLAEAGADTTDWLKTVYNARLGSSDMVDGLTRGLEGCREGDSVLLFITSDLAFGDKPVGNIKANTPVMYVINVESVSKR